MSPRDQNVEDISHQLPAAISTCTKRGPHVADALRPAIEEALRTSARTNGYTLARALFPIIGQTLRMAARDRIRRIIHWVNRVVLLHLSIRSIKWRAESLRTGRSYASVVRKHTRVRRVRQVFLIHRESGLLLDSAQRDENLVLDGDMMSAMLTAIQDFVRDSFGGRPREGLESIQVGGRTVWVEQGRDAILAGIIEGDAPPELQGIFHDALATIHAEFADVLRDFDGDVAPIEKAHVYLEACARSRLQTAPDHVLPLTWLLLALPFVLAVVWGSTRVQDVLSWRAYVSEIGAQPGIAVLQSGIRKGKFYIQGMRDPTALDPVAMLAPVGFSSDDVVSEWEPYQALDPQISLIRATQILKPPLSVSLEIDGSTLRALGAADAEWMAMAQRVSRVLPGIASLDQSGLVDEDFQSKRAWDGCINRLHDEPGIVVLESGYRDGRPFLRGMRDPEARDINEVVHESGVNPRDVVGHWELFASSDPVIVKARALRVLKPPRSVSLSIDGTTLILRGEASHRWVAEAVLLTRAIEGVEALDIRRLVDRDVEALREQQAIIEKRPFRFIDQGIDLWPGQSKRLATLAEALQRVQQIARSMKIDYTIQVYGHVKDGRDDDANRLVSTTVARRFRDVLERQEADCRYITAEGLGAGLPPGVKEPVPKRCVHLRLVSADL